MAFSHGGWSIATLLIFSQTICTQNIVTPKQRNSENHSNVINSIEIESPNLSDSNTNQNPYLEDEETNTHHSRQKRLIWITDDGRLALPPGTTLIIAPTLGLPLVRHPPDGFLSNISVSLPLTIEFDKLGVTDNENPLGVLPPLFARSMGRAAGSLLADYIRKYLNKRQKRDLRNFSDGYFKMSQTITDTENEIPELPDEHKHAFHGGERAILYALIEDFISNFGLDGKACILRAICEVHSKSVQRYGLVGEMLRLFLTASMSPYSDLLHEYVEAENTGREKGECFPYYKDCSKSLFRNRPESFMNLKKPTQQAVETTIDLKSEQSM